MPLFLLFVALPLIEIALFILIGGWLGLWPTLALVVLSALFGSALLSGQRLQARRAMQGGLRGVATGTLLAQGAFRLLAGGLLILPGFFTDLLGLVLLIPPLQRFLLRSVAARVAVGSVHVHRTGETIETEYEIHDRPPRDITPPNTIESPRRD